VPFKETSLKIGGGSLTVYNSSYSPSSSTLTIRYSSMTAGPFQPGELRYESVSAQTDISLQNGAVVMRPRIQSGSVMLAEPRWFYDVNPITTKKTLVINLINITSDNLMAKEGIGTVRMKLIEIPDSYTKIDGPGDVEIDYTTPDPKQDYSVAWNNYFINTLKMQLTATTPPTKTYKLPEVDTLVIKKYEVKIEAI
jgi:hypothetical protein